MSLARGSALRPPQDEDEAPRSPPPPPWLPSHVQVTVVQARGLRAKGGPGDAFVTLQLGRQKHRTSVATQKGGCPRWAEECALEVPPPPAPHAGPDPEAFLLQLTVWQRALVGVDRFLGRAAVPLAALLQGGRSHQDQWYKLHSKPGKKEKDRGEIQLSIQFTRHSLTASMFDLSVKDKPRSPFGRLKDKVTGRQKYDLESASAIVPSSSGALDEDFGLGGKKAKAKGFFFKNKLRKSSLTQSNTSLGSDSTISSASSVVGIGASGVMTQSPSRQSSLSTDHSARDFLPSPTLTHKRAFSDEASQISVLPESRLVHSPKPQSEPISRSSLCINGSHIYCEEPSAKPACLPPASSPLPPAQSTTNRPSQGFPAGPCAPEPDLPPWPSSSGGGGFQKGPPKDPPRFIPSPPILAAQEEDKLSVKTIALSKHRGRAKAAEGLGGQSKPVQIAAPLVFSAEVMRVRPREEGQEEEEAWRTRAGSFCRESGKDSGKSSVDAREQAGAGRREAAARGEEESAVSSGGFGPPHSKEPARAPSSQPGLLATTESAADACFSEDCGPSPFVRVGELQAGSAPQRPSHPEPPARAPPEWDDSFDAFASSRLRPEVQREPPAPRPAATVSEGTAFMGSPSSPSPAEAGAEPFLPSRGEPRGSGRITWAGEEPCPGSPDELNSILEEGGCQGGHYQLELAESPSGEASLPVGAASEGESTQGHPARIERSGERRLPEKQTPRELGGEAGGAWAAEQWQSSERVAVATLAASPAALGQARENSRNQHASPFSDNALFLEETSLPAKAPDESQLGTPVEGLFQCGNSRGPGGEMGEASSADRCHGDEERLGLPPPTDGLQMGMRLTQAFEVSNPNQGQDVKREGNAVLETQEPSGGPPPKPLRRFTPLSSEEEASEALAWPGGASGRDAQEAPGVETPQHSPPGEEAPPPAAAASLALTAIIGAGGASIQRATEDLHPAAGDDEPAEVNELTSRELPSGDTVLVANEGVVGAEQFETCPSKLSVDMLGLSRAKEGSGRPQGAELSTVLWPMEMARPPSLPEPGSLEAVEGLPGHQAVGTQPCATPWEPQPSAPALLWTASEELPPPLDCSGLPVVAGHGLGGEGSLGPGPGAGQAEGMDLLGSPAGQFPPAHPRVLAGGALQRGGEGSLASGSELSPSWPGNWVEDYKKADFWEAERGVWGGRQDTALTPGNPFAPHPSPPLQSNPFAERPLVGLPAQPAALQAPLGEGRSCGDRRAETALQGLLPAPSSGQPPAVPPLHGSRPLAFSTPSLQAVVRPKAFTFPSPIVPPASGGAPAGSSLAVAQHFLAQSQPGTDASAPPVLPVENQLAEEVPLEQTASLHPVKPLSSSSSSTRGPEVSSEEQPQQADPLTPGRSSSAQEKLKPSATSSRDSASPTWQLGKPEPKRDPSVLDHSAKYYHLTHDELIQLLSKREAELSKKQEHIQELENYIDRLLVRIIEQSPTLLQIPLGGEAKAAK